MRINLLYPSIGWCMLALTTLIMSEELQVLPDWVWVHAVSIALVRSATKSHEADGRGRFDFSLSIDRLRWEIREVRARSEVGERFPLTTIHPQGPPDLVDAWTLNQHHHQQTDRRESIERELSDEREAHQSHRPFQTLSVAISGGNLHGNFWCDQCTNLCLWWFLMLWSHQHFIGPSQGGFSREGSCSDHTNFSSGFISAVKLLGIMFKIRCWLTVVHTITAGNAGRRMWLVWSTLIRPRSWHWRKVLVASAVLPKLWMLTTLSNCNGDVIWARWVQITQ